MAHKSTFTVLTLFITLSLTAVIAQPADDSEKAITFNSSLFTKNDVEVKTRLTGVIQKITVERGSSVKTGTPLAVLQNDDLALEVKKAEVSMLEAKAEFNRAKSLFDQKLLSESDYDAKRLAYDKSNAELDLAKVNYEKSVIKAPFSGVVEEVYARIGQRVVEDDDSALFRVTEMEPLQARIFIPEGQILGVEAGLKAEFVPTIDPTRRFAARVKWISSIIDAASGTAPAIVELLPGQGRGFLKPGISGKVTIWTKGSNGASRGSR